MLNLENDIGDNGARFILASLKSNNKTLIEINLFSPHDLAVPPGVVEISDETRDEIKRYLTFNTEFPPWELQSRFNMKIRHSNLNIRFEFV